MNLNSAFYLNIKCAIFFLCFIPLTLFAIPQPWSNPATWPSGIVPGPGEAVIIEPDMDVVLDINPPVLSSIRIKGKLSYANIDINLKTQWIMIDGGVFEIGTESSPYSAQAVITLNGPDIDVMGMGMGGNMLVVMNGGELELHGASRVLDSWVQLDKSAKPGDKVIRVDKSVNWLPGHQIVLAPSGWNPQQAETRTITEVMGNLIRLDAPLTHPHFGQLQTYEGKTLDQRAEVGLLTRNILIQGDVSTADGMLEFGGHVMVMYGGQARVEGVEFYHMGQVGNAGRYSMHFHLTGIADQSYVRNNSIHHSFHRGIVLHGTRGVKVEDNVAYHVRSHIYVWAEDGNETDNYLARNLGIYNYRVDSDDFAFVDDSGDSEQAEHRPGTFWGRNPYNILEGNHAAGSLNGIGFFYDHRDMLSDYLNDIEDSNRKLYFRDNVAHSNLADNTCCDYAYPPKTRGHGLMITDFDLSKQIIEGFTAYKNTISGVWLENSEYLIRDVMLADNGSGAMLFRASMTDAIIIGQSANTLGGFPERLGSSELNGGLHIIGDHGGDKRPTLESIIFIDHEHPAIVILDDELKHGAGSERIKLIRTEPFWYDLSSISDPVKGYFVDKDGSLTGSGHPTVIIPEFSPLVVSACVPRPTWQAAICPLPVPRLAADSKGEFEISVSPNPASSTVNIQLMFDFSVDLLATKSPIQYQLIDLKGTVLEQQKIDQPSGTISIDINNYPSGLYLLEVIQINTGEKRYAHLVK